MMKKQYTLILLLAMALGLNAQITVTNATFPIAGDTLQYAVDFSPAGVTITPAGGPTTWDFTQLGFDLTTTTVFRPASEGAAAASYPTATLFTAGANGEGETYYAVSATSFDNLGFSGTAPTGGLPIQTEYKFDPPVPERRAPMSFIDDNLAESSLSIAFAVADLPDSLPISIPPIADSIRIRGTASRIDLVDAYGTLSIPGGGTYDVLREKRTEFRDTRLDIHTFLGWQDITDLVIGGALGESFGKDTTITYLFFSNTEKEIIATVNAGSDGLEPQSVEYKYLGQVNAASDTELQRPTVTFSPNPASEQTVIALKNFIPGTYSLQVLDASGRLVMKKALATDQETVFLGALYSGSYFYQVLDENGQLKATGKLLKIND